MSECYAAADSDLSYFRESKRERGLKDRGSDERRPYIKGAAPR